MAECLGLVVGEVAARSSRTVLSCPSEVDLGSRARPMPGDQHSQRGASRPFHPNTFAQLEVQDVGEQKQADAVGKYDHRVILQKAINDPQGDAGS
jgi:hypothetical protein